MKRLTMYRLVVNSSGTNSAWQKLIKIAFVFADKNHRKLYIKLLIFAKTYLFSL